MRATFVLDCSAISTHSRRSFAKFPVLSCCVRGGSEQDDILTNRTIQASKTSSTTV